MKKSIFVNSQTSITRHMSLYSFSFNCLAVNANSTELKDHLIEGMIYSRSERILMLQQCTPPCEHPLAQQGVRPGCTASVAEYR